MTSRFTGLWHSLRLSARRCSLAILAASMLASCVAMAAVVSMHPPSGGGELRIPVMLYGDGEETVSGVQFDLNFDPTQFELVEISAGNVATDAGKQVVFSETIPGQGRVLVTGFNNNSMADGQIATVTLRPLTPAAAQYDIALEQALATDPDGNNVPLDYADLFQYPPAAPEPTEPTDSPAPRDDSGGNENTDGSTGSEDGSTPTPTPAPEVETPDSGGVTGPGFAGMLSGNYDDMPDLPTSPDTKRSAGTSQPSGLRGDAARSRNALRGGDDFASRAGYPARTQRGGQPSTSDTQSNHAAAGGHARAANDVGAAAPVGEQSSTGVIPPPPRGTRPADTRLALAGPATGLIDPAGASLESSYALTLDSDEGVSKHGWRATVLAVAAGLPLSLLALYHWLFGRPSRRQRRGVR